MYYKNTNLDNLSEEFEGIIYHEEWRSISGFPYYMVSSFGRIKSLPKLKIRGGRTGNFMTKEKILKQTVVSGTGYLSLTLCNDTGKNQRLVHILVARTFIENIDNLPEVNHKKGIKTDNRVHQLEWNTTSDNQKHSYEIGLKDKKGEKHHLRKLTNDAVLEIRRLYNGKIMKPADIARKYSVSPQAINSVAKGLSWKHI